MGIATTLIFLHYTTKPKAINVIGLKMAWLNITLQEGWNLNAIPEGYTISIENSTLTTFTYNPQTQQYLHTTQLQPGKPYWILHASLDSHNPNAADVESTAAPSSFHAVTLAAASLHHLFFPPWRCC